MNEPSPSDPPSESGAPKFRLKPREFPVANVPVSTPSLFEPTDVQAHFRAAAAGAPLVAPVGPTPKNDIHEILRTNLAADEAAGLHAVKPVSPRPSRRRRDYVIVAGSVNLLLFGLALFFRDAPVVLIFVLAAFVLFNLRLAWSMWIVMDDY